MNKLIWDAEIQQFVNADSYNTMDHPSEQEIEQLMIEAEIERWEQKNAEIYKRPF